ncbi:MAG: 3-deoxy-manno-octulosonate cytidylyltransferase [Myxococcales bacterium]|nr:3-deoxy-manno-octulosonate cytidylyltransferase [Myxococcales bacterium]
MKIIAVIPARYASSRLPGKPLADIHGRPMIAHVYERVARHPGLAQTIVATDDTRIANAVEAVGGTVRLTRADHVSGTDRIAEVAAGLDADLIVNVQGDEPLFDGRMLDDALAPFFADPALRFGTLRAVIADRHEIFNPNCVKVVVDSRERAIYFSRAPIPFARDIFTVADGRWTVGDAGPLPVYYKHLGLYVYRRDFLLEYASWPPSALEQVERLEQLRALERGVAIACPLTPHATISIDTPADLDAVRRLLAPDSGAV